MMPYLSTMERVEAKGQPAQVKRFVIVIHDTERDVRHPYVCTLVYFFDHDKEGLSLWMDAWEAAREYWEAGFGSCDCNRGIFCGTYDVNEAPCGESRFTITEAPWL